MLLRWVVCLAHSKQLINGSYNNNNNNYGYPYVLFCPESELKRETDICHMVSTVFHQLFRNSPNCWSYIFKVSQLQSPSSISSCENSLIKQWEIDMLIFGLISTTAWNGIGQGSGAALGMHLGQNYPVRTLLASEGRLYSQELAS